jgi:preprotein translocase subunit Sec61beta
MASDNKVSLPGSFGGLMRFNEEYSSYINLKPAHVIIFVILIIAIRVAMPWIF